MSGPLHDRIDLRVVMPRMRPDQLVALQRPEPSAAVATRIGQAWQRALRRNAGSPNAALRGERLLAACALDHRGRATAESLGSQLDLTGRGVHRLLRVARTIADLRGAERVAADDLAAAASLRARALEQEVAA